ncbi:MAG TPA: hypothetical protein VE055_04440 [Gaiellaceae bacterium]|nr:hypothetical protein [Gaiellaceae bacterium]
MKPRLHVGRRGLIAGAVLLVVVAGVTAGVLASSGGGRAGSPPSAIQARGALVPGVVLFGDTLTARLDVILDRSKIDPGSMRVQASFSPWKPVAPPKQVRRDGSASSTYIGNTYVLRCLEADCTAQNDSFVEVFERARVTYVTRDGTHRTMPVRWPRLIVDSRYAQKTLGAAGASAAPWKAALFSLPSLTYSISPSLLFALLLTGGLVLLLAAGGLVYLARRRPVVRAAPAPPPPPPAPLLTPLERALLLLELSERVDGAGDQRRALERVAAELARRGEAELARAARALAWSEPAPGTEQTTRFAASARSKITETTDEISS